MASSSNNIQINPVNVYWQIEAQESFDFSGVVAAALNNDSITLFLPDGTEHYWWFNYNSTGVDPTPGGTGHVVTVAVAASASTIATSFKTAVDAVTGFNATVDGTTVKTKREDVGEVEASDADAAPSIIMTIIRKGKDFDLGLLQGDLEPSFNPSNLSITAHQYGTTPLASLSQGFESIECETVLLETDKAKLKVLYKIYGGTTTPASGTEIFGAGSAVMGRNMLQEAARLIFKPVNSTDDTGNFNIALALPIPSSMVFSGENPSVLNVAWQGFIDRELDSNINVVSIGDIFQAGL